MGLGCLPLGRLVSITARDVHPPLYYIIVKIFLQFFGLAGGEGQTAAAKIASVVPFFLCLFYSGWKVRKYFGWLPAGLFAFMLPAMPKLADYTVEVRMYGYALFFVTAAMLHAYGLARGSGRGQWGNWAALALYALGACYTHYFACVAACMVYLYLLVALLAEGRLKEKAGRFLGSGFCCALGFMPWLFSAVRAQVGQVKESYWIQPLSWRSLGGCAKFIFQPSFSNGKVNAFLALAFFLVWGALLAGALARQKKAGWEGEKGRKMIFILGCVGALAGVVGFGFLASFLIRPVFVYRYMIPALGLFWLAFAILAAGLKTKKGFFLPLLGLLLVMGLRNFRAFYGEEMWKRVQMASAREALSQIGEEEAVVCNFNQVQGVLAYYLENESYLWYGKPESLAREMYPALHPLVEGEFTDGAGIAALLGLLEEKGHFWFLGSGNARDEIMEKWEMAGIESEEKATIMIERYWFNIYYCRLKTENSNSIKISE